MTKKTADGVEIVKGMEVWISPFFEADDGAIKFGKLKTYMDKCIVYSIDNLNSRVKLKREGCIAFRAVFSIENIYANKNKAFEKNVDKIFCIDDGETWKDVWGSYLSWSRAYKNVFMFLAEKGKYAHAISKSGTHGEGRGFAKNIDEGLVQHLMIAYFNGWIEWDNSLLKQFFKKASAELRGKAASFLHTGFKPTFENRSEEGKPEWMSFSIYEKELKAFLEHVVELDVNAIDIRNEAKELVNAYGRRGIDNLKSYYDRLR